MSFRAALATRWQLPLFVFSVVVFVTVIVVFRPRVEPPSFDERFMELEALAVSDRFGAFYEAANALRQEVQDDVELGRVHALAARTRARELAQSHQFQVDTDTLRSAAVNYEAIIRDYNEAVNRGVYEADAPELTEVFRDVAIAHWCLNDAENALLYMGYTIETNLEYDASLNMMMVRMLLAAQPEDYLSRSMEYVQEILNNSPSDSTEYGWAFVRKAEILIDQGHQSTALAWLDSADESLRQSSFRYEIEFLRALGLKHEGHVDEAELALRDLLPRLTDRGDIYGQTALALGRINLEQYRDDDARRFFQLVVDSQTGKDWYAAGKAGLAQCAALQHRYSASVLYYQQAAELILAKPNNRALSLGQLQHIVAMEARQLGLLRQYELALPFLEVEQMVAARNDLDAIERFARMHALLAGDILRELEASEVSVDSEISEVEREWVTQQRQSAVQHYGRAGEEYLRLAEVAAASDDGLYGRSLWEAAICFDNAGDTSRTIGLWQRFVAERERSEHWPEALFRLGQSYQAVGDPARAISAYRNLLQQHPHSPAASNAMLPLARSYLALDPPDREAAQQVLEGILNDPLLTPAAMPFRDAMFELGQMHYREREYPQAISILADAITRYPDYPGLGKIMFFVADAYLQSGRVLADRLGEMSEDDIDAISRDRMNSLRISHLQNARDYFERAIDFYSNMPESRYSDLDHLYLRHCRIYRADTLFDLGQYSEALRGYEEVALRYQLTPTALSAFVQIVNCQLKLGNYAAARAANRRAILQLDRMSDEDLNEGAMPFTRNQWQDWFDWTQTSGLL
ncbi:MAG: tetratricopeptide repeat protein [Sedimentisphaerales bacterium]|nr:tetratricopeptide repeat protein [Sedimentisphaerales bacterium]